MASHSLTAAVCHPVEMAHERSALAGAEGPGKPCEQVAQMPSTVALASLTLFLGPPRLFLGINWLRRNEFRPGLQMALQDMLASTESGQLKPSAPLQEDLQNLGNRMSCSGQIIKRRLYLCIWPQLRDGWRQGSTMTRPVREENHCCQVTTRPQDRGCGQSSLDRRRMGRRYLCQRCL